MPAKQRKASSKASESSKKKDSNAKAKSTSKTKSQSLSYSLALKVLLPIIAGLLGYGLPFIFPTLLGKEDFVAPPYDVELETLRESQLFTTAQIPGKGIGVIAVRDIKQGELLIREKPVVTVPTSIETSPQEFMTTYLTGLAPSQYDAFFNLTYWKLPDNITEETKTPFDVAVGIVSTNGVSVGHLATGVFPRMARINHACAGAFNAVYNWRDREEILTVYALKDIPKGSEILVAYTDTKIPRSTRQSFTENNYGFKCSCAVCSLPEEESRISDERLEHIDMLYLNFSTWGWKEIDGPTAINYVNEIWAKTEEINYFGERGRLFADAVFIAASHSDKEATKQWAELAAEWFGYQLGTDANQVKEMKDMMKKPKTHPNWGLRNETIVGGPKPPPAA